MLVLAIDPSGSYYEGKGTTGWALFESEDRKLLDFGHIKAVHYSEQHLYYKAISDLIKPDMRVVIEEFLLYANKAKQQINSKMETSKLIGYLQMYCSERKIIYYMQNASEVMHRWADYILEHKHIVVRKGNNYTALNRITCVHERDAMRHAMHYITFRIKRSQNEQ